MGAHFHKQANKDPLCGFFRWGSKLFRITNSHICLVDGRVDCDQLREAMRNVICRFQSLRDLWEEKAMDRREDDLFKVAVTKHPLSFESAEFRRELMDFVSQSEPGGLVDYPFKLHVLYSADEAQTCVHLGISHDLADVKSGNILLNQLIEEYRLIHASSGLPRAADTNDAKNIGIFYPHVPLTELKPAWYSGITPMRRKALAYLEIAKRMYRPRRPRIVAPPCQAANRRQPGDGHGRNDFFHAALPDDIQGAVLEAAKLHRTTVNTLFSAALVRYIATYQSRANLPAVYTIAVSLRKLLGKAYSNAFRSFMIDCQLRITPSSDTAKLLRAIDSEVNEIRHRRLEVELGRMENAISLFRPPLPKALVYWIMSRTQGTNILYSNPGVIEESFHSFGSDNLPIRDIAIFGCLVHPYDLMFLTPTVDGRLHLTVVYCGNAFQDIQQQFVTPFLHELRQLLA